MLIFDFPTAPVVLALYLAFAIATTAHVVTYKRDVRAAITWVSLIWLAPLIGILLYPILGLNRIHRRAVQLPHRRDHPDLVSSTPSAGSTEELAPLLRLGDRVIGWSMTSGNRVRPLHHGERAYPAMLEAIESARTRIWLCTYIWKGDELGVRFAEALARARSRGVDVRVLIDDIGRRYGSRSILRPLRRLNVPVAVFLPVSLSQLQFAFINLRLHSKLLVVDSRVAFTGGMNISSNHFVEGKDRSHHAVRDLHFEIQGPVLRQLEESFAQLWSLIRPEDQLTVNAAPSAQPGATAFARVVMDGPDQDQERARWLIQGAIQSARHSIRIQTPYFLPDQPMIHALNTAALRGIRVQIVLPRNNNLPWVHWASRAQWWQLLQKGCSIRLSPGEFDHTKLIILDDEWLFIGSSNWDPRSWRLNFELNVEIRSADLAKNLRERFDALETQSTSVRMDDLQSLPYLIRVRDGLARLLLPLL